MPLMLLRRLCALGTALLVVAATGTMASDRQAELDSGKQAFADGIDIHALTASEM